MEKPISLPRSRYLPDAGTRRARAEIAIERYRRHLPIREALIDLLIDLRHLATAYELDPDECEQIAKEHHQIETN